MADITVQNSPFVFEIERSFDFETGRKILDEYRWLTFYAVAVYLVLIFGIRAAMATREKYQLQRPLFLWNMLLASFSIIGTVKTAPDLWQTTSTGLYNSICVGPSESVSSFWIFLFGLSKLPELVDTVFVVLRKKNLIFLHWYHHIMTLLYTWNCMADSPYPARWFTSMNFVIHSLMYSYYAARCIDINPPKIISMCITTVQIIQMFIGVFIHVFIYVQKLKDTGCPHSTLYTHFGFVMYLSYFYLFARFFYINYVKKTKRSKKGN